MIETLCSDFTENRFLKGPPYLNHVSYIFLKPWDIIQQIKILEKNTASAWPSREARKPSLGWREREGKKKNNHDGFFSSSSNHSDSPDIKKEKK